MNTSLWGAGVNWDDVTERGVRVRERGREGERERGVGARRSSLSNQSGVWNSYFPDRPAPP